MKRAPALIAILFWLASSAQVARAQKAIILIRHAERIDSSTDALSRRGEEWSNLLRDRFKNSGITTIYSTQFQRTSKTVEPLSKELGLAPVIIQSTQQADLIDRLRTKHGPNDVVLVVGHSNSVPAIIKELGVKETITIADDQYGDVSILVPKTPEPTLVRLHFE